MLSALLGRFWGYLAAAGAFVAVAGVALLKAVSAGRRKEQAKQTEKIHAKAETAKKVRRAVRSDPGKRDSVRRFDRD